MFVLLFSPLFTAVLATSGTTSPPVAGVTITLDVDSTGAAQPPVQEFFAHQPSAMGMTDVPDMHTAVLRQSDGSYRLWIAGRFESDSVLGATGLLSTTDFRSYAAVAGTGGTARPVLVPSCRGLTDSSGCWSQFDAVYAGADMVFRGSNGDLRMLYHGACGYFGGLPPDSTTSTWCQVGLARSTDGGLSWTDRTPVISGSDAKPTTDPNVGGVYGAVEPGVIAANGYLYAFYSYFALPRSPFSSMLQLARAPLSGDGAPGTWHKYYNGFFSQAGLLGGADTSSLGSPIVPSLAGCTRPAQPWPVWSTYLGRYVLVFVGTEGWFFTTSTDLVNWNVPVRFFPFVNDSPLTNFTNGAPTYENVILVTPGLPEQTIGRTGYVLYAYSPAWKHNAHELWIRPFRFDFTTTDAGPEGLPQRAGGELSAIRSNPVRGRAEVHYRLAAAGPARLLIYDVHGRQVADPVDGVQSAGEHAASVDVSALPPGVYECRLEASSVVSTRRMVVLR